MNIRILPILLAALSFASCAHKAVHYAAPDASALISAGNALGVKVNAAAKDGAIAHAAVDKAAASFTAQSKVIADIQPRVEKLLRTSPVELRPEIEAIKSDVADVQSEQVAGSLSLTDAQAAQVRLDKELADAKVIKASIDDKLSPPYLADVQKQNERLNADEIGWAKDAAELHKLRAENWARKILEAVGALILLIVVFLYFTGKLTLSAAAVAAKIP